MDTKVIIGIVAAVVVVFFAYQWWAYAKRSAPLPYRNLLPPQPHLQPQPPPPQSPPPQPLPMPQVDGQTEADMRAKEPLQQRVPPSQQQPIDGMGPAQFDSNLRHPEQLFHQPQGATAHPTMNISDIGAGRASTASTPLNAQQQPFSPEMAMNGGAIIGNSVFAYDGAESTNFAAL